MLAGFLGRNGFRRGMDLYFARHDGQAVTCDDFLAALADAGFDHCVLVVPDASEETLQAVRALI